MASPLPGWITLFAAATVFAVMLSLGLLLGREQLAAALQRRRVIGAFLFAVVVPVPALAVLFVKLAGLSGSVAGGIVLMAISPGAPIALRRAIEVGGHAQFAPALHLAIVVFAVVTVPLSILAIDAIFGRDFTVTPLHVARQVFCAQLLPIGLGAGLRAVLPQAASRQQPASRGPGLMRLRPAGHAGGHRLDAGHRRSRADGSGAPRRRSRGLARSRHTAAMRNPGLALLIATVNQAPAGVTAAVFGYALGALAVVTVYVTWRVRTRQSVGSGGAA